MGFSQVQASRYGTRTDFGDELARDSDVQLFRDMYWFHDLSRFIWEVDMPTWYRHGPAPQAQFTERETVLIESFRRDGFVIIDQFPGLDMRRLSDDLSIVDPLVQEGSLLRRPVHGYL